MNWPQKLGVRALLACWGSSGAGLARQQTHQAKDGEQDGQRNEDREFMKEK